MKHRGKHKSDIRLLNTFGDSLCAAIDFYAKLRQHIGRAATAGDRAIAVFGDIRPCPAATNAAAVEILNVLTFEPPVPQVSMTCGRPVLTATAWLRSDFAKPASSPAVGPLMRMAVRIPRQSSLPRAVPVKTSIEQIGRLLKGKALAAQQHFNICAYWCHNKLLFYFRFLAIRNTFSIILPPAGVSTLSGMKLHAVNRQAFVLDGHQVPSNSAV